MNKMNETESEARPTIEKEKEAKKTRPSRVKSLLAKKVTSLFISDNDIKLSVFQGTELKKWVISPLEPGVVVNAVVQDSDILSATLAGLFKDHKVKTDKVILGLSGLHAITRIITLPRVSRKILREAVIYEAERELPVPLDTIYLFWQVMESNSQETKVFLVAYAQNMIDSLMNTMRKAGVKPDFLDLAPLAIARCVNSPTSIVFDVRPGELDIVVTIDNTPELLRSVPLPPYNFVEENLTTILPIILDELQRTITFCRSAKSIDSLPIFGFGDLDNEIFDSLSTALNNPITVSCPPLRYPPEFAPETSSVNLGLSMRKMNLPGYALSRRINVNLLPESYKTKVVTKKTLVWAGTTTAVGILAAMLVLFLLASSQTDSARRDLADAELIRAGQQSALTKVNNDVEDLTTKKAQRNASLKMYEDSQKELKADQTSIDSDLEHLEEVLMFNSASVPSGVDVKGNITSSVGDTSLQLSGTASTQDKILKYVKYMEKTNLFSSIVITNMKWVEDKDYFEFKLSLKMGG